MTTIRLVPPLTRRRRVLAAILLVPAIATAVGVTAVEAWRVRRPDGSLFAEPFVYSLADAIAGGDVLRAYAFIRAGQDPNDLIAVRDPVLTRGRRVLVSPLVWAVAAQRKDAVLMLLAFGARLERTPDRAAACLADALGAAEIASVLRRDQAALGPAQCPDGKKSDVPLLSFIEGTEPQ
jgi:hypothetical protein